MNTAEDRRQVLHLRQAIQHARGHDRLDQGAIDHGEEGDEIDDRRRPGTARGIDEDERGIARRQLRERHACHRDESERHIQDRGDRQRQQDCLRHDPSRTDRLFRNVDDVLEADEGVEGQHRAEKDTIP